MYTTFWSVKGGVGVSTVTALWALARAGCAEPALIADLCGDQPALLGHVDPEGPGISEWCSAPAADPAALDRISTDLSIDLAVLHRGTAEWPGDASALRDALIANSRDVVVDAGLAHEPFPRQVLLGSTRRYLVVRSCYMTLRAASALDIAPTGVVLIRERGRALGVADVESVTGAPVVADIAWDPAIARCIDAGLATTRVPRALLRTLAKAQADA